ncbi:MAG: DEAD/DEAH box helicase [Hallerella sp.]|uniref:ATP-dependent RNA helicase DeaD n=1 Tax=Hallerella porci TaxID=1945871 RepID=A0ABX5LI50_9BACT|nr:MULTISPECIES: DEAD/DEAH box helicase [Hallerella]MCI5600385.1 DEAD/DEAH box helicase [Hallerella sp.]PWK93134.1 ATP-dependent RNA helicase DeaD [Hallerella porci]
MNEEQTEIQAAEEPAAKPVNPFLNPIHIVEPENKLPDYNFNDLPADLKATLEKHGWTDLMPVQRKTIPYMLAARDMLVQSKTGSGKTGAFVLPLLQVIVREHKFPQALILVPTRELAQQVENEIELLSEGTGIRSIAIFGGVGYDAQLRALREGVHIIVATPGRLLDHAQRGNVDFLSVRDLIMDEADEMLSMGFYPDMQRVRRYLPKDIACTMFSATIPQTVKSLAREFQRKSAGFLSLSYDKVIANNLEHRYYMCDVMDKDKLTIKILEWENPDSCMIFCNMKRDVCYLEQVLLNYGFRVGALSGDISQKQREETLAAFRNKHLNILICTDVAARGIDVTHVTHVIVYDHPDDHEVYVHRSGRTARAGRSGVAISLITPVEEIELQKTAVDFGIQFIKMPAISEEELANRIRQRTMAELDREKRVLGQMKKERLRRFLPLVDEMMKNSEDKELLAYLLDKFYWKEYDKKEEKREQEGKK